MWGGEDAGSTTPWRAQPWSGSRGVGFVEPGTMPSPPSRRPSGSPFLVLVIGVVVVALGLLGLMFLTQGEEPAPSTAEVPVPPSPTAPASTFPPSPTPDPTPGTPEPTPPPEPEPEPTPEPGPTPEPAPGPEWEPPRIIHEELPAPNAAEGPWAALQRSPLHDEAWPVMTGCAEPNHFDTIEELQTVLQVELDCLEAGWRPILQRLGLSTHPVPLHFFEGASITTPCGESVSNLAFYCSVDGGAIYVSTLAVQASLQSRLWAKRLMFHEYSHHLQSLVGVFHHMVELEDEGDARRRVEVQAECMAMGMLRQDPTWPVTEENYTEIEETLTRFIDDGIHGSPETLLHWGIRGYHSATVGQGCNTWVVESVP